MYILKTEAAFDSAHFLSGYEGKCSNIHGHRWNIVIEVSGENLDEKGQIRGMVVDFKTLKKDVREFAEELDHCLIIEKGSMRDATYKALKEDGFKIVEMNFRPTAENFAKYLYDVMEEKGYKVEQATVYETPSNSASYRR